MKAKITDEAIARALGHKVINGGIYGHPGRKPLSKDGSILDMPAYTTDLNAMVGAIEELGLDFSIESEDTGKGVYKAGVWKNFEEGYWGHEDSACLALAAATLSFLKERK